MKRNLLLTVALILTAVTGMLAQGVTKASINGLVTDQKGEALPGASVVAIHVPSGTKYGATSRSDGRYDIPAVRVGGPYTVTVSFIGFEDKKMDIAYLDLDQRFSANFSLGESSTTLSEVQVLAENDPVLNSERTGAATNVRREQFERLPSISRSFQDMAALDPRASSGGSFSGRSYLYNNFTIDGATTNNVFGLSNLPGGQTNSQPISLDAIQAMTVSTAPYDVRQGAFTGAGINSVTRSGTNEFSGSVYGFYRNQNMVGTHIAGVKQSNANFNFKNYGFRLGGPLIKDKLFFFVNYEQEQRVDPAVTYPVNTPGNQPTANSDPTVNPATNLEGLRQFVIKTYGYDPGTYNNFNVPTQSTKALAKIDWNIDTNNKLTIRYNQLSSFRDIVPSSSVSFGSAVPGGRTNSVNTIPFSHSWYRQNNNLKSVIMELNSNFGSKYSNTLTLGYNQFRDFREQGGGGTPPAFPTVDILGPNGSNLTTIGPDPFTPNNKLYQDIIQVNDNFNIYLPNNAITIGTANEFFKFNNTFTAQINGIYQYTSIANFEANAPVANGGSPSAANAPTSFGVQYSAIPGNPAPGAIWNASQTGIYAQDEITSVKNLRIVAGMRVDIPVYSTTLPQNPTTDAMTFVNGEKIQVGKLPKTNPLLSPRIGFNWDVHGDKTLQVRGGTGLFTGRVPFVWLSNQVTNNGLLFGSIVATGAAAQAYNFSPTPVTSNGGPSPQFSINATVPNFKFPQVFRTNIAVDKTLPGGFIGTLEFTYTKDVHAIYVRDANLSNPIGTLAGDGRPVYPATVAPNPTDATLYGRRVNTNVTQALVLDNSNKGYQYSMVAQLQRSFAKGFYVSGAYAYTDSRDINSQSASTASSVFTGYPTVGSPNNPALSYSSNYSPSRVVIQGSYRKEYARYFASTFSLIYTGNSGNKFSYTYSGDVNNDGNTNDLIYIPKTKNDILLTTTSTSDTRTTDQIWQQLDSYINQDKYLKNHRGQYAARNGATAPWVNLMNIRILQDFYIETGGGKRNTLQLSFECINVLNLLNSNWGLVKSPARTSLLTFAGYENPAVTTANTQTNPLLPSNSYTTVPASGRAVYRFPTNADGTPLASTFINNTTISSRWQMQLGLRYIFN
jgi:Carboxypeptidase regulatory-like domain